MKLSSVLFGSLAFTASANAQYFSEGWAPGKAVPTKAATQREEFVPGATPTPESAPLSFPKSFKELSEMFDLTNILGSGPVASFAARAGYNITEKLSDIKSRKLWDERIPLITDDNYDELIVNEPLTEEEEDKRAWFLVITTTASGQEGVSKFVDSVFDSAYDISVKTGDLPNIRWGRIDYLNVTVLTTKWAVWSAPYIVVVTDRGQSLRFYRATQIRVHDEVMRTFLREEGWKVQKPWKSAYSPGGEREWIMEYLATWLATIYNNLVVIPKWLLYVITGAAGSVVIGLLHRSPKKPAAPKSKPLPAKKDELPARVGSPLSAQSSTGSTMTTRSSSPKTTTTKKGGAKSKKTGKK